MLIAMKKVRWGVLGVAGIAVKKVIPGMQRGASSEIVAIASRDLRNAEAAAASFGIAKAYGSYDELLADSTIEAVYIPLPNHLHAHWTARAADAGKHVLCEKPIAMNMGEAEELLAVRDRTGVLIQEAFMVRSHPQWLTALDLVRSGRIGRLCAMTGFFSYYNDNPSNIRNIVQVGGGALMDIGCYLVTTSRLLFEKEPARVFAAIERDPAMGTDRLTSITLDFGSGQAIGTCSTQLVPYQRVHALGTRGRIEFEIPFNVPPDRPVGIVVDEGKDLFGGSAERIEFATCDQYTIQGDLFSQAIREGLEPAVPLEDSVRNMSVIDALFRSAGSGRWETLCAT
jgi:predicted dehydrogenase